MAYSSSKFGSGKSLTFVPVSQGAAGSTTLAAGVSGKKHKVVSIILTLDADSSTLKFSDGVGDLTGAMPISSTGGLVAPYGVGHYLSTAVGQDLNLVTSTGKAFGVVGIITE